MKKIYPTVAFVIVLALAAIGTAPTAVAQYRQPYRNSDRQMQQLIRRIETRSDRFSNSLEQALDRSRLNGTTREDEVNKMVTEYEHATDQLKDNFNNRRSTAADVENVLTRAAILDTFVRENRLTNRAERDWMMLRGDLDQLARNYSVAWNWNRPVVSPYGGQLAYRVTDQQMRQLINRIETRSDSFSNSLSRALDRSAVNNTSREDEINKLVTDFEAATDRLKQRVERRESTDTDVQMVLQRAALLNSVMTQNRFEYQAERDWTWLKGDLDRLANAYRVTWNWDTMANPSYSADALLTGTFRLNSTTSDNPRVVADNATRYLPYNQRQRVTDNLLGRLTPPEMISIERRGQNVMLASTRSPQVTIDADGRERAETYPNGRASSVRAGFQGDQLTVVSNGDRSNDFTVTFAPVDQGRRLLVTRQVYAEQLNQPVIVRSYYDRTSDVAQWNVYNQGAGYTSVNTVNGDFVVPDGVQLMAVLNNNLSTNTTRDNERFTMTVRSPSQFDGAVLEGYVSNVSRGGRITGRSEMTLNFDSIRLRDGRTYKFAGIVENALASNGESVRVDNEGAVEESNSRTSTTATRTTIGGAIGALIGAIAGGGKGAAIGAIVGAGAGAGSVYIQGSNDLELMSGTQFTVRASAPLYNTIR
ncbi:MAG TPA: hypothetical protein VJT09_18190 [Pyrinomonadaceae bacterium]|nr:hypothetical protein [Pyrinomonadaceae bacterium]